MRTHHRTLLKVILNPILRKFGFQIVSCFNDENDKFIKYEIRKFGENFCKFCNDELEKDFCKSCGKFNWEKNK